MSEVLILALKWSYHESHMIDRRLQVYIKSSKSIALIKSFSLWCTSSRQDLACKNMPVFKKEAAAEMQCLGRQATLTAWK